LLTAKILLMEKPLSATSLRLGLDKKLFPTFTPLLQRGVRVKVQAGCSLRGLLEDQFGLNPEYMKDRIKTVFLDGKPVDDWDTALVKDGSVLALSAAMPGLAGATLRRGGVLAGMRFQIPQPERITSFLPEEGFVVVKLFNLLIPELGPSFLQRGVFFTPEESAEFCQSLSEEFWQECKDIKVDGKKKNLGPSGRLNGLGQPGWVWLSIQFSP
jgi:hypothetical protein